MKPLVAFLLLSAAASRLPGKTSAAQNQPSTRQLHFIITDNKGESVENVQSSDISVTEDNVAQAVESFELVEMPVHYGLVVDTSGSLRSQFPTILETSNTLLSANGPEDRTFILRFINKIEMVQNTTSDKSELVRALGALKIEQGQTALLDAIYFSATELQKVRDPQRRKALVVITDGENRASRVKESELFKLLREADLKIFIVGLVGELDREGGFVRRSPYDSAVALLERLAKETAGRVFFVRRDVDRPPIDQIAHEMRKQYVLKYRSSLIADPKSTRKVEIKVSDSKDGKKRKTILRTGYTSEQLLNLQ